LVVWLRSSQRSQSPADLLAGYRERREGGKEKEGRTREREENDTSFFVNRSPTLQWRLE